MRLNELFAGPTQTKDKRLDPEIDYISDLKFFIDNDDEILSKAFFPAIKQQRDSEDTENHFKLYIKPIRQSLDKYCHEHELFDIKDDIFPADRIVELAKRFAEEQAEHIKRGSYES